MDIFFGSVAKNRDVSKGMEFFKTVISQEAAYLIHSRQIYYIGRTVFNKTDYVEC